MTARALKELLNCMPEDVLDLDVWITRPGGFQPMVFVLIDPPDNLHGVTPKVAFSNSNYGEQNPEIICKVSPRK